MTVFNINNNAYKDKKYPLFLGQVPGIYDSINVNYSKFYDLFEKLKSIDWTHNEINLSGSRLDLLHCSESTKQIMLKNLAFQWELDSIASRSIAPLLAPFVTNSELWLLISKISENENLHALTYSEIVRQCVPNVEDIFKEMMQNEKILNRGTKVLNTFDNLQKIGAEYTLGILNTESDYKYMMKAIFLFYVALYSMERIQFMASFACTFALAEQGLFLGMSKYVQKIMKDELTVHAEHDKNVLKILMDTVEDHNFWMDESKQIIDEIVNTELAWNTYIFSEDRSIVGLNKELLDEWVLYNAKEVYKTLKIKSDFKFPNSTPLVWFTNNWLDLNKVQNANQETDSTNYKLSSTISTLGDDILDF